MYVDLIVVYGVRSLSPRQTAAIITSISVTLIATVAGELLLHVRTQCMQRDSW